MKILLQCSCKAELLDPEQWADIIEASGAKYVSFWS